MQLHYRIEWHLLRPIARSYFRLTVQGDEHIPHSGPVLLASNHCSYLDPLLIALGIPRQITFLAKEELFRIPVFSHWMRWNGAFPVSRGQGDVQAMRQALRLLKQEKALLVFPEGTRSSDGMLQTLESGIAWLALKSGAPIVPAYIAGTAEAQARGSCWPRPCKVHIEVGPPLPVTEFAGLEDGFGRREGTVRLLQSLADRMQDLQSKARSEISAKEPILHRQGLT